MMEDRHIKFEVYGDESVSNNAVVYALIVIPIEILKVAEQMVDHVKERYGIPPCSVLHCRIIFHNEARKRSPWKNLSEDQIFSFTRDLAKALKAIGLRFIVSFIDKTKWPKIIPEDGPFKTTRLDSKQFTGFAFMGAMGPLDANPGFENIRLWVDPDHTRIPWFGKRRRADKNYEMFSDISGKPEPNFIKPEPIQGDKPVMLQGADLLAYTASHALSLEARRDKPKFISLYNTFSPEKSEMLPRV